MQFRRQKLHRLGGVPEQVSMKSGQVINLFSLRCAKIYLQLEVLIGLFELYLF